MPRKLSSIAPDWWDYTTLDSDIIRDAAALTPEKMQKLSRPGFKVVMYDTLEDFYLAEALEYIAAWRQSTPDNPVGICGPIGPTEQLPLVARLVNELDLNVKSAHFWGMDEWFLDGKEAPVTHPLSFEKADRELCFNRIRKELVMPDANLHFPKGDTAAYRKSWDAGVRCAVMQGGQGDVKHWAFNDPPRRAGKYKNAPPSPAEYRKLDDARRGSASADHRAERAHLRRRQHLARADAGDLRRAGRDVEGGEGLHLARRQPRQSVRPAADLPDDREEDSRCRRADVAAGRSSERAVQLLPRGHRHLRGGDALNRRGRRAERGGRTAEGRMACDLGPISRMSAASATDRFEFERELWSHGLTRVAGVDEAGRGPLAGPVVAAAVDFSARVVASPVSTSGCAT